MKILEGILILFYLNCLLKTIQFHQFWPNCECRGRLFKEGHCRRQIFYVCFRAEIKASEWISWKKERNLSEMSICILSVAFCRGRPNQSSYIYVYILSYYDIIIIVYNTCTWWRAALIWRNISNFIPLSALIYEIVIPEHLHTIVHLDRSDNIRSTIYPFCLILLSIQFFVSAGPDILCTVVFSGP